MAITYACACGNTGRTEDKHAGKRARCRRCGNWFHIGAAPAARAPVEDATRMGELLPTRPHSDDDATRMGERLPAMPRRPGPPPLPGRRPPRRGWPMLLAVVAVLAVVGAAAAFWLLAVPASRSHAVVEVGSKGIKVLALDLFRTADGADWKVLLKKDRAVGLGAAVEPDGTLGADKLAEATAAVAGYVREAREKHGVPLASIHLVASSGLLENARGKDAQDKAKAELRKALEKASGRPLEFVGVDDEVRLGFIGSVPPTDRLDSVLVDIGGGNTKAGYFDEAGQFYGADLGPGASALLKAGKAKGLAELVAKVRAAAKDKPGLLTRGKVCLIGGAAWGLGCYARPGSKALRLDLSAADIVRFARALQADGTANGRKAAVLARVRPGAAEAATKQLDALHGKLQPAYLMAGAEILETLSAEMGLEDRQLQTFTRGDIAWPLGYALEKSGLLAKGGKP